ncbi:MAG: acyl-CoA dehydrogenase family protein [Candidatus Binatales bacterium]
MDFGLSDEQRQLKETARDFLRNECPTTIVRKMIADADGIPRDLYREIAKLGWTGLIVPEKFGGAGMATLDMAVLLEECGYAAMPGPFLFSSAIAAHALAIGGSEQLKSRWLPALAEGRAIGTIAIVDENDSLEPRDITAAAAETASGFALLGIKMFVPYAHLADFIIVAARVGSYGGEAALFVVETATKGVSVKAMQCLDLTRRIARVELDGVQVAPEARLHGEGLLERVADIGAVAIAADSLGGTGRALEMAVEYSKVREQFGKPIGSFQALKHAAAEIVADLEPARALLWYAAYAQSELAAEAPRAAAMAKARLSEIYSRATDRAVLMHGGIGFTWEHDIQLWFKRARFNESYFGSPTYHRERVAALGDY